MGHWGANDHSRQWQDLSTAWKTGGRRWWLGEANFKMRKVSYRHPNTWDPPFHRAASKGGSPNQLSSTSFSFRAHPGFNELPGLDVCSRGARNSLAPSSSLQSWFGCLCLVSHHWWEVIYTMYAVVVRHAAIQKLTFSLSNMPTWLPSTGNAQTQWLAYLFFMPFWIVHSMLIPVTRPLHPGQLLWLNAFWYWRFRSFSILEICVPLYVY